MVDSTSEEMPLPRVLNKESISSKKMMTGTPSSDFSRARWKISRIWRSLSPTYLLRSSGPLMLRKYDRASSYPVRSATASAKLLATALAMRVFPQPGGP